MIVAGRDSEEVRKVLASIAKSLCHLHHKNIVHRQVNQKSVYRDAKGDEYRLSNFDCALRVNEICKSDFHPHSSAFLPPEHFLATQKNEPEYANAAADVWTFGVLCYELCSGLELFASDVSLLL